MIDYSLETAYEIVNRYHPEEEHLKRIAEDKYASFYPDIKDYKKFMLSVPIGECWDFDDWGSISVYRIDKDKFKIIFWADNTDSKDYHECVIGSYVGTTKDRYTDEDIIDTLTKEEYDKLYRKVDSLYTSYFL